jgi:hypothetical protein
MRPMAEYLLHLDLIYDIMAANQSVTPSQPSSPS